MAPLDEITQSYYATTAARGHRPTLSHYETSSAGLLRRLGPWLPKRRDARCLDLACGCGELLFGLEKSGFTRTYGVDLCAEELEEAAKFVRAKLVVGDVIDYLLAEPEGSFDLVTAFNLVEHLPKERLVDFFRAVRRALAKGGSFVGMVPNAVSPFGASTRYWDITHHIAFTPNSITQLATMAGFTDAIEFRECGPVPYGVKSSVRWVAWQALRGAMAAWFLVENGGTRGGIYSSDMLFRLGK